MRDCFYDTARQCPSILDCSTRYVSDINITQDSVAKLVRCGGTTDDQFIAKFSMKEFLKQVNI